MEILTDDMRALRERLSRRAFLGRSSAGLGALALGAMLDPKRLFAQGAAPQAPAGAGTPGAADNTCGHQGIREI